MAKQQKPTTTPAQPALTTNPLAAAPLTAVPAVAPVVSHYMQGKPYAPRNTGGAAHTKQGDVAIFNGFVAAMQANNGVLTPAAAAAAVKAVNPKNMAFIKYCVTRGWLVAFYNVPAAPQQATPAAQ